MMIDHALEKQLCQMACVDIYSASTVEFGSMNVLYSEWNGYNVLNWQGSASGKDWKRNLCFWPKKVKGLGKFHGGYWKEMEEHHDLIMSLIPLSKQHLPLIVMGHSKGAAEAQLFFVKYPDNVHHCFMWGSPKPIKKLYDKRIENIVRHRTTICVNPFDFITKLMFGWDYIGKEVVRKLRKPRATEHAGAVYVSLYDAFDNDSAIV